MPQLEKRAQSLVIFIQKLEGTHSEKRRMQLTKRIC